MHEVLRAFFDPTYFRQALPDVWAGFVINLKMMLIAEALVLVFALVIAIVRGLPGRGARPLRGLAILYTDFFRGTPLTIVAFVFILGIPGLRIHTISNQSNMVYGIAALTRRLHRLRDRGLPRRDRVRARQPADGGALARALVRPGAAVRRPAAGDPAA